MDGILLEPGIKKEVVRDNFRREKVIWPTELPLTRGVTRWVKKAYQSKHSASKQVWSEKLHWKKVII